MDGEFRKQIDDCNTVLGLFGTVLGTDILCKKLAIYEFDENACYGKYGL